MVFFLLVNDMHTGSVFLHNRTQSVRLPKEVRFSDEVKKVNVRIVGNERILTPVENTWDSFFLSGKAVTGDFMNARAEQAQTEREPFDD